MQQAAADGAQHACDALHADDRYLSVKTGELPHVAEE